MRVGQNPAKFVNSVAQPAKYTIAVVSYIPFLGGYYSQSLDLLKVCLDSIWMNTDLPFDLIVFDNASCEEVRAYLLDAQAAQRIRFLILSDENVGKAGAWNFIFGAAPGEYLVYADSDIYFYPGWLPALTKVMETFPEVGMVTGMPLLNPEEFSTSTVNWAERNPGALLERGRLLPWKDYWRHAGTLGSDEAVARDFFNQNDALVLNYQGEKYYIGAGHFQFMARSQVLREILPLPSERPMGQVRALDVAINTKGYLRLCTNEWWVEHLGNTLIGWKPLKDVPIPDIGVAEDQCRRGYLLNWKPFRKMMTKLHNFTFDYLYKL